MRTRDYFLFILTIAFLVIGIGATVADTYREGGFFDSEHPLQFVSEEGEVERTATQPETGSETRADRLASLRAKIAAGGLLTLAPPESPVATAVSSETMTDVPPEEQVEIRCSNYVAFSGSWPSNIMIEEVEGARVLYVDSLQATTSPAGTSTVVAPYVPAREVIVELPVRTSSFGAINCIYTDVIGIARDGSLIRNNNVGAYAIFGSGILLGYALDGYPIYGSGTGATDSCGGVTIAGQYRYQISGDRQTIINCYSGVPVQL